MNNAVQIIRDRESHKKAVKFLKSRGFKDFFLWTNVEEYHMDGKIVLLDLVYMNERARRLP